MGASVVQRAACHTKGRYEGYILLIMDYRYLTSVRT